MVVQLAHAEAPEYARSVMSRILELSDEWLLLPRYGSVSDLELLPFHPDMMGVSFAHNERPALVEYLGTRPTDAGSSSADLYVLSGDGDTLVTWDHHTAEEGLSVELQSVVDSTRLLVSLNELGAEMEVYYSSGLRRNVEMRREP